MRAARGDDEAEAIASEIVAGLDVPYPWDVERFTASVALLTGRPITVHALPKAMEESVTGLWRPSRRHDHVYVTSKGSETYREHVLCHELAHVLLDRAGLSGVDADERLTQLQRIAPHVPVEFLNRMAPTQVCFARSSYQTEVERRAEWVATLIQSKAESARNTHVREGMDRTETAVAARFARALRWRP